MQSTQMWHNFDINISSIIRDTLAGHHRCRQPPALPHPSKTSPPLPAVLENHVLRHWTIFIEMREKELSPKYLLKRKLFFSNIRFFFFLFIVFISTIRIIQLGKREKCRVGNSKMGYKYNTWKNWKQNQKINNAVTEKW